MPTILCSSLRNVYKVLNRSPATIEAYSEHIRPFLKSVNANDIKQVTTRMIENYIAELYDHRTIEGKPYKASTICLKVRSIKRLFEFLEKANIIFIDPAEFIKEPKVEKDLFKKALSPKEVNKILDQPNLGTRAGIRDRSILELFYSTGIRKQELCNLTIYDADLSGRMLRVNQGKGQKDRVVPMGKHAAKFLREYITKVRPHFTRKNRANRHLFVDIAGKPIRSHIPQMIVKKYCKAAKIKKQVSPHTFRHTFAVLLVKNGADITAVQKMLGHAHLTSTQGYLRSLGLDLKKHHCKTHPRERDRQKKEVVKPMIERRSYPRE